jgi:hypothetical protein
VSFREIPGKAASKARLRELNAESHEKARKGSAGPGRGPTSGSFGIAAQSEIAGTYVQYPQGVQSRMMISVGTHF